MSVATAEPQVIIDGKIIVERGAGSFAFKNGAEFPYQLSVYGDTKPHRVVIKSLGGVWDWREKKWRFSASELPADLRSLIERVNTEAVETPVAESTPPTLKASVPAKQQSLSQTLFDINEDTIPEWFTPPSWWTYINLYIAHRPATTIVGPAGNGKTTTAEIALTAQGYDYEIMSCTDRTEVVDLVGGTVLTAEGEQWRDGLVTRCFKEGKAVILDEADALDPRVMMSLQTALLDPGPDETSRFVTTPDGKVFPAGNCPILMTMNTVGSGATRQYVGRNRLDSATMDRLSVIQTKYENETDILKARGVSATLAGQIIKWAENTRKRIDEAGLALVLSPRTLMRVAESIETFMLPFDLAVNLEFYSRIDPDQVELVK